jgi:hypothetical protein
MEIVIDGIKDLVYADSEKTLDELLLNITRWINENNRIVTKVVVDNASVTDSNKEQYSKMPLLSVQTLEITTDITSQAVVDVLVGAYSYIPLLVEDLRKSLECLRAGEGTQGYQLFSQCLTNWIWINDAIMKIGILMKLDYSAVKAGNENMAQRLKKIMELLDQCSTAMNQDDEVAVADVLEYELIPRLEGQSEIAQKLAALVKGKLIEGNELS